MASAELVLGVSGPNDVSSMSELEDVQAQMAEAAAATIDIVDEGFLELRRELSNAAGRFSKRLVGDGLADEQILAFVVGLAAAGALEEIRSR